MNKTLPEDFVGLRNRLLNDALLWISIAAVPGVALSVARMLIIGWKPLFSLHLVLLALLWLLWLGRNRIAYRLRVFGLLTVIWLAIFAGFIQLGPIAFGGLHAILFAFIAVLFLSRRIAGWLIAFNTLCLVLFGLTASRHWLEFNLDYQVYAHHPLTWASAIWAMTAYAIILALIGSRMVQSLLERETVARKAEQRLSASLENMPNVAVQWYDLDGRVQYWNHASELIFGWTAAEASGKTLDQLMQTEDQVRDFHSTLAWIDTHKKAVGPVEYITRHRDGRQIITSSTLFPIPSEGAPLFVCMDVDITEGKQAEAALEQAKLDAEFASLAKSEFLTNMSHELRTPLNAIIGFSQLLEMDKLTPADTKKEAVGHIMNSGRHLLNLINEILDLARIESGNLDFKIETVALLPLIEETVSLSLPAATPKHIDIQYSCSGEIHLHADLSRVRQILLNLLSNAIKYNRQGGNVMLSCDVVNDSVRITIVDTGTGIPDERRSEIFQPFHRLGIEKSNIEGTGMGLVISKRLIEGMGGRIGFDSTPGGGSRFWFELPLALSGCEIAMKPSNEPEEDATDQQWSIGKCVLYIEDSPVNVEVMKHFFRVHQNIELLTAENAETGLAMIHELHPDLVLMDISLPGMSGLEALHTLKSNPGIASIPVIAVSAAAMPEDIAVGLKAGFLAYLTKPFDVHELNTLLRNTLQKSAACREE
jgi:PAS domain S-box-containing protein